MVILLMILVTITATVAETRLIGWLRVTSFVNASEQTNVLFGMNRNGNARFVMDDWYCRKGAELRRTTARLYCSESYPAGGAVALHSTGDFLFGDLYEYIAVDDCDATVGK